MIVRALTGVGWDVLAATFTEAFSDYAMPIAASRPVADAASEASPTGRKRADGTMTAAALAEMQVRRGYVADVSYGAYAGDRLIGFVLTGLDGDRAYNSGTGVVPSYRRTGVARQLLDAVIAAIGDRRYLLEVLESNDKAIAFYRSAGFTETRRFSCWTVAPGAAPDVPELAAPDLDAIAADADVDLSWQNSVASIRRAPEPYVVLGDEHGAAVVFPGSADLPLLAVPRTVRRRGHGARLLAAAAARCTRPMRILNIDTRAHVIEAFLAACGAVPLVRQLEMVR